MSELMTRAFEVRLEDEETRTVRGMAVPYGETIEIGGFKERFERGAFGEVSGVKLFYAHKEPIGRIVRGEETEDGFEVEAVISKTPRGDEVYTLLRDGVLDKFSVGFLPLKDRMDGKTLVRESVSLKEVSVVAFPAYSGASVSHVRSAEELDNKEDTKVSNEINEDVADLRESVDDLERRMAVFAAGAPSEDSTPVFRSGGEFLKALASGDDNAKTLVRAYTGATTGDSPSRAGWVDRVLKLVDENRNVVNLFAKAPLPPTGNSIEYPQVASTAGTVGVQAAEGDDLPYMEIVTETKTAPVKTYGGYSALSRQVIERSDVSYLDAVLRFQGLQYAKATNKAARDALVAGNATYNAPTGLTLATAKGKDWLTVVINSVAAIEDNGFGAAADFALVSRDVYAALMTLTDSTDRPVFTVNGDGTNTFGNANVKGLTGTLAGIPLVVDPGLAAKQLYVCSADALTVYENPGAPVHLQDENIVNLTKLFSLYGYLAVAIHNPKGIAKPAIA